MTDLLPDCKKQRRAKLLAIARVACDPRSQVQKAGPDRLEHDSPGIRLLPGATQQRTENRILLGRRRRPAHELNDCSWTCEANERRGAALPRAIASAEISRAGQARPLSSESVEW